ncbi:MAG: helicase HerA domain-containing protein, partial [Myxococcales bacterium]
MYRVREPADLEITEFEGLKALEQAGCQVRFSTRLHAKLLLVDDAAALVSSSNLTASAGYSRELPADARNEELGVLLRDEPAALASLAREFERIWAASQRVDEVTVGIAMDFPATQEFRFVAIREVRVGQYVVCRSSVGGTALGRIVELTAYNRSFPRMNETMWLTQGFGGGGQGATQIPDLQTLFSHPSKERGMLVTRTFFEPEPTFQVARVEVLRHRESDLLRSASVPVAPGAEVALASDALLRQLLGDGDVPLGHVLHHAEVPVPLRGPELFGTHLAALGMTGSGKSNALKVLVRNLMTLPAYASARIVIVDTHGEYTRVASQLAPAHVPLDVRLGVRDEDVLKALLHASKVEARLLAAVDDVARRLRSNAAIDELADALEEAASETE